jgi:hypothetical protein
LTCVCWDGKSLAADRLVIADGTSYTMSKIWRLKDGSLFSGCGLYDQMVEVADWLDHGAKHDKRPWLSIEQDSQFLLVYPNGSIHWLTHPYLRPVKYNEKIVAMGSGGPYALGAMKAGADAKRACEIALELDSGSGRGVTVMKPGVVVKKAVKKTQK